MISLTLNAIASGNKKPVGKIIHNNIVVHEGVHSDRTIEIPTRIGPNSLIITLENKLDTDTIVKGNEIIDDLYVILKDVHCVHTKDYVTNLDAVGKMYCADGRTIPTNGYINFNGFYMLEYDYPLFRY